MDDSKAKALAAALAQIEKQFGKGSIMRMSDGQLENDIQAVSTGSLGLDIALGPKNNFVAMFCSYMPINAPVGLYKEKAKADNNGMAGIYGKPVVIKPDCKLVDVYMTVDGKAYEE